MSDIELVIKIPEEVYEHILKAKSVPDVLGIDMVNTINAVKNSTLLPKGHGRLIDENAIAYNNGVYENGTAYTIIYPYNIENAPTIIEADRKEQE